jgi:cytochrome d ubiquinol oxidase subunit I
MSDPVLWHRLQFAFTIIYHYLFPQLTMGLALLIVVLKWLGLRHDGWNDAARFWIRIFGINFAVGVVTGVPMEFQFGTNWAAFSRYAAASSARRSRWRGCSRSFSSPASSACSSSASIG